MKMLDVKLVELPQSQVIVDISQIYAIGEPSPGQWIVASAAGPQAAVIPPGDKNILVAEMKRRGLLNTLEMPKAPNE